MLPLCRLQKADGVWEAGLRSGPTLAPEPADMESRAVLASPAAWLAEWTSLLGGAVLQETGPAWVSRDGAALGGALVNPFLCGLSLGSTQLWPPCP